MMYAIVEIAGKQFRVEKDMVVKVPYLNTQEGKTVDFERVLMFQDEKGVKIGRPSLEGVKVVAEIIENGRDKKILVFKKKRRKGYRVLRGHRQHFTKIRIQDIVAE